MMLIETCPICLQKRQLTNHHLWRRAVYGRTARNNEIEKICDTCHQILEAEITRKENQILRQYPEIYAGTFNSFLAIGEKGIEEYRKKHRLLYNEVTKKVVKHYNKKQEK